uniref:DnaJ homolog subfamily C member 8 n=1 Tax=Cyprinus carpio carpio TaxID=630221 RepID=A0A8C1BA51_CYPCA
MAAGGSGGDEAFQTFYTEVKQIEKRDSVLTSKQQIDRLLRPGASYFNLNPFEVLQIDPDATDEELKKRFRQLSILVHPDKNQDDVDRAQLAFEAVDKAYKMLLEPDHKKKALDVIHAGKEYVEHTMSQKRKQLKKDGKPTVVEEDDPEVFRQAVYKQTMKLFAELEIKRKERETKEMHERDSERKRSRRRSAPRESESGRRTSRRRVTDAWTAGGASSPKARLRRKRRTARSSSRPKSRWSSASEALLSSDGLPSANKRSFVDIML